VCYNAMNMEGLYNKYFWPNGGRACQTNIRVSGRALGTDFFLIVFFIIGGAAMIGVLSELGTARIRDRFHVLFRGHGLIEHVAQEHADCLRADGSVYAEKLITKLTSTRFLCHHEARDTLCAEHASTHSTARRTCAPRTMAIGPVSCTRPVRWPHTRSAPRSA
jgi:hypothetical protein